MTKLRLFFKSIFSKKDNTKVVTLDTVISSVLIPTTGKIKRIEVFETTIIDPLGVTLELKEE